MPRTSRIAAIIGTHTLTSQGLFDPVVAHTALVASAEGYFANAGGNGGEGGTVLYVQNLNDSGPNTIHDFMTRPGPLIILFENGVDGIITQTAEIGVQSNKTLWGRHRDGTAADITIAVDNTGAGFAIENAQTNVIISNFKMTWLKKSNADLNILKQRVGV